jgi:hypothetical protein
MATSSSICDERFSRWLRVPDEASGGYRGGGDLPIALLEDVIAIGGAILIVRFFLVIKTFDAIIIGAGQAGPSLAGRLTGAGMSVALIERKLIGETCVNKGCTPTKTLVASAYAAHVARRASEYGLTIGGPVGTDIKTVRARKDAVAGRSRTGLEAWLKGMANCTVYKGHARFEAPHERERNCCRRAVSSSMPAAAHSCPTCPASKRSIT